VSYTPLPSYWAAATPAARDAAYNSNAAVPDSAALIEARNAASAAFRAAHPGHLDLAYGPGPRNRWDLYPAADPSAPCLVFIHGGYWQRNSAAAFACVAEAPLARGWSCALPGHTLAPEASMTAIVAEIHAALDWLAANRAAHGMTGPVVLSGWSSGGHLAALAMDHPLVTAGLCLSGLYELAPFPDLMLNEQLRLTAREVTHLSPMRLPPSRKRVAIAYGAAELPELRRHSRDFHAWRAAAQGPGPLIPVAGCDHFRMIEALRQPEGELMQAAMEALRLA
jgi:acetyl esterase/lipase